MLILRHRFYDVIVSQLQDRLDARLLEMVGIRAIEVESLGICRREPKQIPWQAWHNHAPCEVTMYADGS